MDKKRENGIYANIPRHYLENRYTKIDRIYYSAISRLFVITLVIFSVSQMTQHTKVKIMPFGNTYAQQ